MKKSILVLFSFLFLTVYCNGQESKDAKTKMDEFTSKTGVIIKFEDYKLDDIKSKYRPFPKTEIRKLISGGETKYFYRITKNKGKYGEKTVAIAYEDITEIQKALTPLKNQSSVDLSTSSDYIENKFVTEDGFAVGYYVSKGKLSWYIRLKKYGSGNTVFMKDISTIEQAFNTAKAKIDELKELK